MPYKDPERKRQWEQARRHERTERRRSQRQSSPVKAEPARVSPVAAAALVKVRQLREGKPQGARSKTADPVHGAHDLPAAGDGDRGSGWKAFLALAVVVVLGFLGGLAKASRHSGS